MRRTLLVTVTVTASLAGRTAVAGNGGFGPVPPESPNAEGISRSYWFISVFVVAIFLLVERLLIAFLVRYRRRHRPRDVDGAQIHGSTRLELLWTAGPVVVLFVIAVFVFVELPGIADVPAAAAAGCGSRSWGSSSPGSTATRTASSRSTTSARPRDVRSSSR